MKGKGSVEERISKAYKGRKVWLSLIEKFKTDQQGYVVILPSLNKTESFFALKYLPLFIERKNVRQCIVLVYDDSIIVQEEKLGKNISIEKMKKEDIDNLMQFYCLYEFSSNIVIASLEYPSGRMGKGMAGKKGITDEEVFAGIVYGLV